MICIGLISLFLGGLWDNYFPINKNLWTSSYVLWTSGISLLVFSCCFALIDILGYKKWSLPFKVFGMNALFAFIFHVLLIKLQVNIKLQQSGAIINLKTYIMDLLFSNVTNPQNAGLFYSISFIVLNYLVVFFLYKRKIFIRI
jgi:predicted acyltransferase